MTKGVPTKGTGMEKSICLVADSGVASGERLRGVMSGEVSGELRSEVGRLVDEDEK